MAIPPLQNIIVTKHALQRIRSRFPLTFNRTTLAVDELAKNLIAAQVSKGRILLGWQQCPFYVNRISTEYGLGVVAVRNGPVVYVCVRCTRNPSNLIVRTVVRKWLCEYA